MKICIRCLMDDLNDPDITFDINGQCNYCAEFDEKKNHLFLN